MLLCREMCVNIAISALSSYPILSYPTYVLPPIFHVSVVTHRLNVTEYVDWAVKDNVPVSIY